MELISSEFVSKKMNIKQKFKNAKNKIIPKKQNKINHLESDLILPNLNNSLNVANLQTDA